MRKTLPHVLEAIHLRHAVRGYAEDPVTEEEVRTLLDAAVHAPTAMHAEPWGFVVIQDKALLKRFSDQAKRIWEEHLFDLVVTPDTPTTRERRSLLSDPAFNIFYDAGTLIVVCRRTAGAYAEADCWLAAGNIMHSALALGLGSCCIGFAAPVLNTPEAKAELGIPEEGAAIAPIIVGVPRGPVWLAPRKPPAILRWVKNPA